MSSRHCVLHNHDQDKDENLILIIMPVLDMINHSLTPNAAILPFVYNFDQSSYLQLVALRDIQPNE